MIICNDFPCDEWNTNDGLIYMTKSSNDIWASTPLSAKEPRAILSEVLNLLPSLQKIDDDKFQVTFLSYYFIYDLIVAI